MRDVEKIESAMNLIRSVRPATKYESMARQGILSSLETFLKLKSGVKK